MPPCAHHAGKEQLSGHALFRGVSTGPRREELRQAELELPEAFAAWPGELVELNLAKGTGRGLWRVRESVCGLTAAGTYTRLTLGEP